MTDIRRIGDSGVHTVEGNVAGGRAARLTKERDAQQAEYEAIKGKIKEQNAVGIGRIDDKFNVASDAVEQEFRKRTVGLVSAEDFRKARDIVNSESLTDQTQKLADERKALEELKKKERAEKRKKLASSLSFDLEEEPVSFTKASKIQFTDNASSNCSTAASSAEHVSTTATTTTAAIEVLGGEGKESPPFKKKVMKNPEVDTSYLPDRDRDLMREREKARLRDEWLQQQEVIKNEVTSYK